MRFTLASSNLVLVAVPAKGVSSARGPAARKVEPMEMHQGICSQVERLGTRALLMTLVRQGASVRLNLKLPIGR